MQDANKSKGLLVELHFAFLGQSEQDCEAASFPIFMSAAFAYACIDSSDWIVQKGGMLLGMHCLAAH